MTNEKLSENMSGQEVRKEYDSAGILRDLDDRIKLLEQNRDIRELGILRAAHAVEQTVGYQLGFEKKNHLAGLPFYKTVYVNRQPVICFFDRETLEWKTNFPVKNTNKVDVQFSGPTAEVAIRNLLSSSHQH